MYETEGQAQEAVEKLREYRIQADAATILAPSAGQEQRTVDDAVSSGRLAPVFAKACVAGLRQGRWVVAINTPFGIGSQVEDVLRRYGPIDTSTLPVARTNMAAPLSEALGLPVLTEGKSKAVLAFSDTYFTPNLLLSNSRSTSFGLPQLTGGKGPYRSTFGIPLLTNGRATIIPMPTLTGTSGGAYSSTFGIPLLWNSSTPLSGLFGLPVLTRRSGDGD
ncbi:MAG: hypothetical protein ACFCGT_05545 [Sandaracinaceae bacterium]